MTSFSTLEEAWGATPSSQHNARGARRQRRHAAFADSGAEPFAYKDESRLRRARRRTPWTHASWPEAPPESFFQSAGSEPDALTAPRAPTADTRPAPVPAPEPVPANLQPPSAPTRPPEPPHLMPRQNENHDVFLYVFSGVLLLFVLEQFVQVGQHIGLRRSGA